MEKELALMLLLPEMQKRGTLATESEIREAVDKLDRMSFGQLIARLRMIDGAGDFCSAMQDALHKRNDLAHHFFDRYRSKLHDSAIQQNMRAELQGMICLFDEMFEGFHKVNISLMNQFGICDRDGNVIPENYST